MLKLKIQYFGHLMRRVDSFEKILMLGGIGDRRSQKDGPCSRRNSCDQQRIEKQRRHFAYKGPSSQSYGFSSSHVWIWELDCEESWTLKNWWFWIVMLEKTLESPLNCKEIEPVNSKGNQPWIFIGRRRWNWSSNILATWCKEPSHWKRPWSWERLRAGEGGDRG